MATVSIIMGLLALGVAVSTLVWCQKLAEGVTRLRTNPSDADVRQRLAELASEFPSLHARADHLRQCWQADTSKLESIIRQLENRMAELEQGHRGLATMSKDLDSLRDSRTEVESVVLQLATRTAELEQGYRGLGALTKDLDSLRDFRSHVERVHAGIQKAFNGALSGITVPALPDDERPPRDG